VLCGKNGKLERSPHSPTPWTDNRPHSRIADQFAGGKRDYFNFREYKEEAFKARSRGLFTTKVLDCNEVATEQISRKCITPQ
jgi:hypothetical protein